MDEGMMGLLLGLCVACIAFVSYMIDKSSKALEQKIEDSVTKIGQIQTPTFPTLAELREEMEDLIHDSMSTMRTPQIADHLGAILQQWAQVKFAKEMQGLQGLIPSVPDLGIPPDEEQYD